MGFDRLDTFDGIDPAKNFRPSATAQAFSDIKPIKPIKGIKCMKLD